MGFTEQGGGEKERKTMSEVGMEEAQLLLLAADVKIGVVPPLQQTVSQ